MPLTQTASHTSLLCLALMVISFNQEIKPWMWLLKQ